MQVVTERTPQAPAVHASKSSLQINKLPNCKWVGAEALGVDLSQPVDDDTRRRLIDAVDEHVALVVRNQTFRTAQGFLDAARVFGTPIVRPAKTGLLDGLALVHQLSTRDADSTGTLKRTGEHWHTDHTNLEEPTNYTMLYPVELPVNGGRTLICNTHAGYLALPEELRKRVDAMKTANVIMGSASRLYGRGKADSRKAQQAENPDPAIHPLVRTHPKTGKRALYFNQSKMENIVGMDPEDSQEFLEQLLDQYLVKPEFIYTHEHRIGDMFLWDNRSSVHMADHDYQIVNDRHRVMYRIIAAPEKPF